MERGVCRVGVARVRIIYRYRGEPIGDIADSLALYPPHLAICMPPMTIHPDRDAWDGHDDDDDRDDVTPMMLLIVLQLDLGDPRDDL